MTIKSILTPGVTNKTPLLVACIVFVVTASPADAVTIIDPGFESYDVEPGGFTKAAGPWVFMNDAGVVEPFSPNSSSGVLDTWSATYAAIEGEQYASTYAGADTISQSVNFETGGLYTFRIFAAAPSGSVTIPPSTTPTELTTGVFSFTLGGTAIGSFSIDPGTDWMMYSATTSVREGFHVIGIRNTATAPYFINYDEFSVTLVPIPAAAWLFGSGIIGLIGIARRKKRND